MANNINRNNNNNSNNRPNRTERNLALGSVSTRTRSQAPNILQTRNTQRATLTAGMTGEQASQANHAYNIILNKKNINFLSDEALHAVMQPLENPALSNINHCEHRLVNLKSFAILSSCTNINDLNIMILHLILEKNGNTNILSNTVMNALTNLPNDELKNDFLNRKALTYDMQNNPDKALLLENSYIILKRSHPVLDINAIFRLMNMDTDTRIQSLQFPTLLHGMNNQQRNGIFYLRESGRLPVLSFQLLAKFSYKGPEERFNSLYATLGTAHHSASS